MVHSQEMAKVRMENADLKAQLYGTKSDSLGRVTKSTSLRSRPKSSVVAEFRQTSSTRPTMHSVQSEPTGAELPDFATQTAMSMEEKLQREKAEENEKASKTASTVMDQLRQFLQSNYFDAIISCVLFANVMFLAFQLQMEGSRVGYDIDYYPTKNPNDSAWPGMVEVLQVIENIFTVIFSLDVLVRIVCLHCSFWKSAMNWIDFIVVTLTIGTLVLDTSSLPLDPIFLRLLRLGKLARAFRMIILSGKLESFGLLLKCVVASVTMLGYATGVLIFVQCVCGMIISTLVSRYLEDPAIDKEARRYVFQYWGTFSRTFLTMFEVLFANWAPACRSLTDYVSEWFTVVFVGYRCVVGFALLNVVNSVFVSQTLKIADSDEEYLIKVRARNEAQYRKKLHALFLAADTTDDGFLTIEEFMQLLENPQLQLWLSQLQLEYHDLVELFGMIDSGDGRIDWKEFMDGAVRLKGQAKSMDVFRLETKVDSIMKSVASLHFPFPRRGNQQMAD
ncbi:NaCP60E [Symbiodinium sp. CCMP2592]|nr:NaCP60E [Symbiodinium sp. CCMP2592]